METTISGLPFRVQNGLGQLRVEGFGSGAKLFRS